ncbi:FRG domain-containing protein [Brachybacterium paraconglomeratum]
MPEKHRFVEDYFSARELNKRFRFDSSAAGFNRFWEWVSSESGVKVPGPEPLCKAPKYFRGQTRSWYGFTSSLYRICKQALGEDRQVDELHLAKAENAVINALRNEGMGRRMTDGELLMIAQHHLVPTRLIDVSTMPLEALFFAVEKEDGTDGRFFIVAPHQEGSGLPHAEAPLRLSGLASSAGGADTRRLPWADAVRGTRQARDGWSIDVRLVDEEPLDSRMRAQAGKFLVGGVHRSYGGLNMPKVTSVERPDISCLAINFAPKTGRTQISQSWRATGWSVRVHASWKPRLREMLASLSDSHGLENIEYDSMYPPIGEIERLGKHVARQFLGQTSERS